MTLAPDTFVDLPTPTGPMRTHLFMPSGGDAFPALMLFSEIFQVTGPIRRLAAFLAGHGFLVAVPEVYHEYEPAGTVLAYDTAGADRGNELKYTKPVSAFDSDAAALAEFLQTHPRSTGKIGSIGMCLGGHLALRAALLSKTMAAVCFYPTDLHQGSLGAGKCDDTLARIKDTKADLVFIWGRQDPHIPWEGRVKIHAVLESAGLHYAWLEVNAAHAFLRDEGPRYNPALAALCLGFALDHLTQRLGLAVSK
jgi:carboxymethylenebutenolidase